MPLASQIFGFWMIPWRELHDLKLFCLISFLCNLINTKNCPKNIIIIILLLLQNLTFCMPLFFFLCIWSMRFDSYEQVVKHIISSGHEVHVVTAAPEFVFRSSISSSRLHIRKVTFNPCSDAYDSSKWKRVSWKHFVFLLLTTSFLCMYILQNSSVKQRDLMDFLFIFDMN